jgi:hypothetical protein
LKLLNDAWNKAWLEKDVAAVERMRGLAHVYIDPNGQVLNRRAILAIIRYPSYHLIWGTRTEVSAKALGEAAALAMHRWQGEGARLEASLLKTTTVAQRCAGGKGTRGGSSTSSAQRSWIER